ncbi:hypothetical protein D3C71_2013100 [compost metagenome]
MVEDQQISGGVKSLQHRLQQQVEPLQLHTAVGNHQEFGQRQLALAEDGEG